MAGKRRVFGAAFKAKVALAAAKGDRTAAQLASQFSIHASHVPAWKKQLMDAVANTAKVALPRSNALLPGHLASPIGRGVSYDERLSL